jgi:putative thioredoxin
VAAPSSATILDVGDADFDREVVERSFRTPVIVDFWAPWCAPCRAIAPVLAALAEQWAGALALAKVNVDQARGLAQRFAVRGIPAVKIFREGAVVDEFVGALPESMIRDRVRKVLPTEADRLVREAAGLTTSEPAAAEAKLRDALAREPDSAAARIALADRVLSRGELEEADRLLEGVLADGPLETQLDRLRARLRILRRARALDTEAVEKRLTTREDDAPALLDRGILRAAREDHAGALEDLLRAARIDRQLGASDVREAMVDVFHLVGLRSDLADDYRKRLAAVLY